MDVIVDSLISDAAREVGRRAVQLTHDVLEILRRELPELWEDPGIARMTEHNVGGRVLAVLTGLEHGVGPTSVETSAAGVEGARRLARHGTAVNVLLRAFRLGQEIVLGEVIEQLPRLTDDADLVCRAARRLISIASGYVDQVSEHAVAAFQEERDRRLQWRLSLINEASVRIGTTLDIARTTQELADFAKEGFADVVTAELFDSAHEGCEIPDVHRSGSMLQVPLRARGSTLGIVRFERDASAGPFGDDDILLAEEIASRAAVAIDNARRYTHAHATALTLQRSLLPQPAAEQLAVDVACRYLPAGVEAGVGGDWYDVVPLSGSRVALVVGDVVGHGLHAAAAMGRLRTAVRTLADFDLPPDELLTHLDDVVLRLSSEAPADAGAEATGYVGATCLYAVYDPVSRQCALARAGHLPPVVVPSGRTADLLELPYGPPLGLGGLPFEATEVELAEGSLLALYTDGLVEARGRDVETGLDLFREALTRPSTSLEDTCDAVLEALLSERPSDDVALLLVRTRALDAGRVADWDVDDDIAAVSRARANVARQLGRWGLEELEFTAELVVSELVTNAIRYGHPPIRLRLIFPNAGTLICEVSDTGSTTPHLRRARSFDEGGRGLLLVAQLAASWGTRHARQGKTVWAELNESAGFAL